MEFVDAATRSALEDALGSPLRRTGAVSGGDISDAYLVELEDARQLFVKTQRHAPVGMFAAEAAGLEWLAAAFSGSSGPGRSDVLAFPKIVAVADGHEEPRFLVLEYLAAGAPCADFDERLGRGLAALHRAGADHFGWSRDNFIGSLPQSNRPHGTWVDFYRQERIEAQLALPRAQKLLTAAMRRDFDVLLERLDRWTGPPEPPARLHGDLWGGNLLRTAQGLPALIDPAVYAGHREMDLAMMRLFGGFSPRAFSAYAEAFPLAPGHEERVALWQLYPLLVHVNLFGSGYLASVSRVLERYR
jgi:fructosamine-3-kinase